ncbi:MAG: SIS domain-containing protein [Atopobiaceae bacterium]|jgi:tagatose-6-phosphate ketose/aldose isomerase|nr:SIS domain-containing protein [Atopobiaceae bacterium]MCH4214359.1 SIS domain-containing protein [Atopobiaceae bacterium]MCH4229210.1 SIS domain-containing protein [Atopobiaceae bacterium]MCH4276581.1 SIS domain-containing protein [Atopobiaceae bacterium]MCI1259526.1 SIS domain-containing protein [Atopobiaceae bacterium]
MFEKDEASLKAMGADITTREIKQQPDLWEGTYQIYLDNKQAISEFLDSANKMSAGRTRVVFTGAGTSAYVGDTVAPYLRRVGHTDTYDFAPVASTDIVSAPLDYLRAEDPTILVSFARSGNSPESLAAVERAGQIAQHIKYLNITCAPEGKLAVQAKSDPNALTILIPDANDQGFAMTGSYSCMELMSLLIFDPATDAQKKIWVDQISAMGRDVISREPEVADFLAGDYDRLTYLGSGSLGGLTREAQLKVLELAAGKMATSFDTSMGYRHGPKSFVDGRTLVFVFVSNDAYTRQYDLDILHEIDGDAIAQRTVAVQQDVSPSFENDSFTFTGFPPLPEGYLALPYVMFAQVVSLLNSIKVGNTPDTPSPSGTVNRVVKGVTIHPFNK